jgi:hypothetical protein
MSNAVKTHWNPAVKTKFYIWKLILEYAILPVTIKMTGFKVFWNTYIKGIWDFRIIAMINQDGEFPLWDIQAVMLFEKNKKNKRITLRYYKIRATDDEILKETIPAFFNQLFSIYEREGYNHFHVYCPDTELKYINYFEYLGFHISSLDTLHLELEENKPRNQIVLYKYSENEKT